MMNLEIVELRNYLLAAGRTRDFLRYFEEHFLFSQRAEGMYPLGQFEVVGEPDRFVWIRGFADMAARRRGLEGFYGGAFWQARRDEANAMMREHHDVHLLRPLGPLDALTGGRSLEDMAGEPAGTVSADTGLVVADFHRAEPGALGRLVDAFERVQPALVEDGHQVLGHFVAELAPNDYPRLPVIQDPAVLVVLSAYRDREHHAAMRASRGRPEADASPVPPPLLAAEVATLALRPTARSIIRYEPRAAERPAGRAPGR
jgi:hypothetical protein